MNMKYFNFESSTEFSVSMAGVGKVKECVHIRRTRDDYELFIVTEGELFIDQDGKQYRLGVGDYLLVECNKEFGGYDESTGKFLWTHFICDDSGYFSDSQTSKFSFPQTGHLDRYDLLVVEQTLIANNMLFEIKRPVADAMCAVLLRDIASTVTPLGTVEDNDYRFQAVMQYFLCHPYCNEFDDVKSMAEYFGYSEKYLYDLFKHNLMQSPHKYLNAKKMQRAMGLLADSDMTIKSIASTLHYDYYYFMRLFKKETGFSPTQYRKIVTPNFNVAPSDNKK